MESQNNFLEWMVSSALRWFLERNGEHIDWFFDAIVDFSDPPLT